MKKRWYDFLWIASAAYLALGLFNILFAWLGLLCFFIPLVLSAATGTKAYCNRSCSVCWEAGSAFPAGKTSHAG